MNAKKFLVASLIAVAAAATSLASDQGKPAKPFVVHEWGTFLSVQGSDGMNLGGMVDSDEVLPTIVDSFGPASYQRASMFIKMETPVTYFYSDIPRTVQVRIDMPKGLITHWYPIVRNYGPNPSQPRTTPEKGFIEWRNVQLLPQENTDRLVAPVGDNQSWRFARETDAALLKVTGFVSKDGKKNFEKRDQYEKFLFYRGLGGFNMPLSVRAEKAQEGNSLHLKNSSAQPLTGIIAVHIENQTIRFGSVNNLPANGSGELAASKFLGKSIPLAEGVPLVKQAVARTLVEAGLYEKEAQAMVNTWEHSYFRTEGLRLLYILPRPEVDAIIPIRIQPTPEQLVRVMVGRVEVLTPERERQIESFISQLGATDFRTRQAASDGLARLGRIGEPALRRVAKTTQDAEVRARASQLIRKFDSN
ncbi:hypothetical protein BH10PLA2_BH10PLA2_28570 [soil metagenome]